MDDDSFDIDPALAAQMGFSSFGGSDKDNRAAKRQKQDHPSHHNQSTGANNVPVGAPRAARGQGQSQGAEAQADSQTVAEVVDVEPGVDEATKPYGGGDRSGGQSYGQVYDPGHGQRPRHEGGHGQGQGVQGRGYQSRNAAGDAIYYDPSFIEDPWAGLAAKRWGER